MIEEDYDTILIELHGPLNIPCSCVLNRIRSLLLWMVDLWGNVLNKLIWTYRLDEDFTKDVVFVGLALF